MRQYMKKIIIYFMTVSYLFMLCPSYVYASDHGGGGGTDHNSSFITDDGTINVQDDGVVMYYIEYILANIGAIIHDHDLTKAMANDQTMKEYISKGKFDAKEKTVTFPKETVIYVKQSFDQYAKEAEPYYLVNTLTLSDCAGSPYNGAKIAYDTVKNLLDDSPSGIVAWGCYYSKPTQMWFVDIGNDFKNVSPVKYNNNTLFVNFYDNETWGLKSYTAYNVDVGADGEAISSADEFKDKAQHTYNNNYINTNFRVYPFGNTPVSYPYNVQNATQWLSLITKERRRIRVFNTYGDFQNYTLGKRSVYYTSNYYNYVPEDITTSVDDLQKSVDDLQNVLDNLLDQITKDTDESEIEDLLQQILDELKNQQGTGNGSGSSGGGDVTVNIDMTQTNSWLAKIYAKVSQIYDKMNATVEAVEDAALANIQESLDEIIEQLKKIKNWTAVDTVIDGVDAVADWLDLIRGVVSDGEEGVGAAVTTVAENLADSAESLSTKFPFSIPWDILFFISVLAAEPQVPYFEIPIDIEMEWLDINTHYDFVIDFSQFQWLSDVSRLMLSMTYAVGLLKLTMNIALLKKEE